MHLTAEEQSRALEGRSSAEILAWAADRFAPRIVFTTGFGVEGCVLIHLIATAGLPIAVVSLDTGVLFQETYELWRRLEIRYGIEIRAILPSLTLQEQATLHGASLWERDPDLCCRLRKVEPLAEALKGQDAWISAIRRDQTAERRGARIVDEDARFGGVWKVSPLLAWTSDEIWAFVRAHEIPFNPLHDRGYPSIGCTPCTSPVVPGEDPRAGRWRGKAKTECGLHQRASLPLAPETDGTGRNEP